MGKMLSSEADVNTALSAPHLHEWSHPWLTEHWLFKVAHGGRMSGKTVNISGMAILLAIGGYPGAYLTPPVRFLCCREQMNSVADSVRHELVTRISEYGLDSYFKVTRSDITCSNGSLFRFRGLKNYNSQTIKGFSNFDVAWIEEAHEVSHRSMDLLVPTIHRKENSEIWASLNRNKRSDWVDQYLIAPKEHPSRLLVYVNYDSNPDLSEDARRSIELTRETMPEKFAHIYLGKPDDGDQLDLVLTEAMVTACIRGGKKLVAGETRRMRRLRRKLSSGTSDAGIDLAGRGTNALAIRKGPMVEYMDTRSNLTDTKQYEWAFERCREFGAPRLYFDATGVGAHFENRHREAVDQWQAAHYPLGVVPERFGGKVAGADTPYLDVYFNKDQFEYRTGQLAWMVRIRAMNSVRFMAGEDVNPALCLFFSPSLPQATLDSLLLQLTHPEYILTRPGKVRIDKDPDESGSPHLYDALVLSFARDSEIGIILDEWR